MSSLLNNLSDSESGDHDNTATDDTQHAGEATRDPLEIELYSLRCIYKYSCEQHCVRPRDDVLRQLPPVVGKDWVNKVQVLDFSLTYVGREGCATLVPVVGLCTAMTHLLMPSIGLTEEAAWFLLHVLQAHPSVTWIDFSGNRLNDNVGRWILTMVLENSNICFVHLSNTGISPPLILKIERQLQRRRNGSVDGYNLCSVKLDMKKDVQSGKASLESSLPSDGTRGRRLPAFVASGLAELRHLLYSNRHSLQHVYDCFVLPQQEAGEKGGNNEDSLVDIVKNNDVWDVVSVSAMYTGLCSWRAFFRGLRLLGIHSVSHSLTESVTFATICGICNLETICFGKLLDFLRPHVAIKTVPSKEECGAGSVPTTHDVEGTSMASEPSDSSEISTYRSLANSHVPSLHSRSYPVMPPKGGKSGSRVLSAGCIPVKALDTESSHLVLKPNDFFSLRNKSVTVRTTEEHLSITSSFGIPSCDLSPEATARRLEEKFRLDRFFTNQKMQYVVDRLYDARATLRGTFQQNDTGNSDMVQLASLDEVMERSVSIVGETYRETVMTLLYPWTVNTEICSVVDTDEWISSMYIPDAKDLDIPPLSISEERRMWKSVETEVLRNALSVQ